MNRKAWPDSAEHCPSPATPDPAAVLVSIVGRSRARDLMTGIGSALRNSGGAVRRWWHYRRTVRELSALEGRMLKDLGLHRSEIPVVARKAADAGRRGHLAAANVDLVLESRCRRLAGLGS